MREGATTSSHLSAAGHLIAYVGQTRSRALIRELEAAGIGECTARGELLPRRRPWFYDNGAFRDWKAGKPFNEDAFQRDCDRILCDRLEPDFLVVPDLVGGGVESLALSVMWVPRLEGVAPLYLAVQDGMDWGSVEPVLEKFDGVFVGGSLRWKMRTAAYWRELRPPPTASRPRRSRGQHTPSHVGESQRPSRLGRQLFPALESGSPR